MHLLLLIGAITWTHTLAIMSRDRDIKSCRDWGGGDGGHRLLNFARQTWCDPTYRVGQPKMHGTNNPRTTRGSTHRGGCNARLHRKSFLFYFLALTNEPVRENKKANAVQLVYLSIKLVRLIIIFRLVSISRGDRRA